jgi:hypothetical protein
MSLFGSAITRTCRHDQIVSTATAVTSSENSVRDDSLRFAAIEATATTATVMATAITTVDVVAAEAGRVRTLTDLPRRKNEGDAMTHVNILHKIELAAPAGE